MIVQNPPRRVCFQRSHTHHICTLPAGHNGEHQAWDDHQLVQTWPQPTEGDDTT